MKNLTEATILLIEAMILILKGENVKTIANSFDDQFSTQKIVFENIRTHKYIKRCGNEIQITVSFRDRQIYKVTEFYMIGHGKVHQFETGDNAIIDSDELIRCHMNLMQAIKQKGIS